MVLAGDPFTVVSLKNRPIETNIVLLQKGLELSSPEVVVDIGNIIG